MATLNLTADAHLLRMPTSKSRHTFIDRFRARYNYLYQGLGVLATEGATDVWTVTPYPGIPVIEMTAQSAADLVFYGGQTYTVSAALGADLTTAGYTVEGPE